MTIAHVVTGGFGNGTFAGQIRQVVLDGFFDSAVAPIVVEQVPNLAFRPSTGTFQVPLAGFWTGETSYSASGLTTGITLNTSTGVLSVNTATASTTNGIVVSAINASGTTPGNAFNVKISAATGAGGGFVFDFDFGF